MINILDNWNDTHHAIIVEGGERARDLVLSKLEKLGFEIKANPDLNIITLDVFGIEDAREFIFWSGLKPIAKERKVAVVCTNTITLEAQNSLLKCFEEPSENTNIFFIVRSARALLPTLLSRTMFYSGVDFVRSNLAQNFLRSEVKDRFSLIRKNSNKADKNILKFLMRDIEALIYKNRTDFDRRSILLRRVIEASKFANLKGGSPKMLLEWLAVSIPEKL